MAKLALLSLLFLLAGSEASDSEYRDKVDELTRQASKALPFFEDPVEVSLSMSLRSLFDVDTIQNKVSFVVWKKESWDDTGLEWDDEESEVSPVNLKAKSVWQPDTVSYNLVRREESLAPKEVVVYSSGKVELSTPLRLTVECDLGGVETYSGATCELVIGSWNYDVRRLTLADPTDESFSIKEFSKASKYEVLSYRVKKSASYFRSSKKPFDIITFSFAFRLKYGDYSRPPSKREQKRSIRSFFQHK
ncbi:acetylcholine-binding protein [Aplysia californica]|uniref:Acetylcholine-binding protein n=1 Tax=Aplysia californica TaxID=6500 RepID=A0ABM0JSV9_APLCA|nr:acetylcholine-binding protein [Aplysia californica]